MIRFTCFKCHAVFRNGQEKKYHIQKYHKRDYAVWMFAMQLRVAPRRVWQRLKFMLLGK